MKLKIITVLVFIIAVLIPISTYGITQQDNGKIKVSPVTSQNFEGLWLKGIDIQGYSNKADNTKELISSTHNNLGYHIFLNVNGKNGEMKGEYTKGKQKMQDMHYKEVKNDTTQNIDGIDLLVKTQYLNNGNQVQIIYTLKNTTKNTLNISLGTSADVEIDGDDTATIEKLNNGATVRLLTEKGNTKKKAQFMLYLKNAKGVTNVDNIWIGNWSDHYLRHIFDNNPNVKKIEERDSAITFSWTNKEIKPGEIKNYSVVMDIGEQNAPSIKIPLKDNEKLYHSDVIINGTIEDKDLKDTITIHYNIDNNEYTLPPIQTEGKEKSFSINLINKNLSPVTSHKLKIWAVDSLNLKSVIEERNFTITYLKNPKLILSEKNWTKNEVTFKIIDTENEQQYVEKYQYKINDKQWIDCNINTNTIIKENGINKIDVRAVGIKTGDISTTITDYAKIDKVAPTDTKPTATKTTNSIAIKCTQIDEESGIDESKILYTIKEGNKWKEWQTSNIFTNLKPNTKYVVKTKTSDKVENTSESKELAIKTEQIELENPKKDKNTGTINNNKRQEANLEPEKNTIKKDETNVNKKSSEIIEDKTVANIEIPKTGDNYIIPILIFILSLRAIIYCIKLKTIKNRI